MALVGIQTLSSKVRTIESLLASTTLSHVPPSLAVIDLLQQLGMTITNTIARFVSIVTDSLTANSITTDSIIINDGIRLKDKNTGEMYCVQIASGDWLKSRGDCGDASANPSASTDDPAPASGPASDPTGNATTSDTVTPTETPAEEEQIATTADVPVISDASVTADAPHVSDVSDVPEVADVPVTPETPETADSTAVTP